MNNKINQKISQFLDGELHHSEMESLLLQIKQQPELKSKMNRYQAASHVLRTDDVPIAHKCLLNNINQELQKDPHYFLPKQAVTSRRISGWQKTSLAIAASVVCVAVFLTQQTKSQRPEIQQLAAQKQAVETRLQAAKETQNLQHERFKAYLLAHSDDIYTHGSLSIHPLASVANYNQD
jgi:sigma-E factor negative regulatory protein RseA